MDNIDGFSISSTTNVRDENACLSFCPYAHLTTKRATDPRSPFHDRVVLQDGYFIIAAATFLNAAMSASMCARVYVGCVQKEIVESASECATLQLNFV